MDRLSLCLCCSKSCNGVTDANFTAKDLKNQKREARDRITQHKKKMQTIMHNI